MRDKEQDDGPKKWQDDGPKKCLGGRFDLLDCVGIGGGAVVMRARDRQLHWFVAVKLLRSRDADLRGRFTRESMVLAGMDHPAIVRVLAHDSEEEPYTVLELIEGPDLCESLARSGPLPWRQALQIGIQIADALDAAHRQGLVHRDVKPANIMFADAERAKSMKASNASRLNIRRRIVMAGRLSLPCCSPGAAPKMHRRWPPEGAWDRQTDQPDSSHAAGVLFHV